MAAQYHYDVWELTGRLRFVQRGAERVLQQEWRRETWMRAIVEFEWRDVPQVDESEG